MIAQGLFWTILRRLWHNRRLVAATLLGFVIAVSVVCSIPAFSDGALQRILSTEAGREETPGRQPAALSFSYFARDGDTTVVKPEQYDSLYRFMTGPALEMLPFQPDPLLHLAALDVTYSEPADPARIPPKARWIKLGAVENLQGLTRILDGRIYRPGRAEGGALEAVITDRTGLDMEVTVGAELLIPVTRGDPYSKKVKVRIVGVIPDPLPGDPLFYIGGPLDAALLMDLATFRSEVLTVEGARPGNITFYMGQAAAGLRLSNLNGLLDAMYTIEARAGQMLPGTTLFGSPKDHLVRYARKGAVLRAMLLVLSAPLLALVGYYLLVTASLTVDRQRQEIAVLRSRGAGMGQIVGIYLTEGTLFAGLALLLGPPLGLLVARAMGAAAGFVQFVDRRPLEVALTATVYEYGAMAALVALAATLIPAVMAGRESIVSYKLQQARASRTPFWHRYLLDLLLVGLSVYGWWTLTQQAAQRVKTPAKPGVVPEVLIDPLHFVLPAVLIAGAGLLLLRLLPRLARGLELLTRRWAGAPLHLALTQVSRQPGGSAAVVLLLTLTVGLGLYGAAAARTLERSYADRIWYRTGADVVLTEVWEYDENTQTFYEPPWGFHREVPGVAGAARVYRTDNVTALAGGRRAGTGTLMAVDPPEFAGVAWFRRDLERNHLHEYLNLLAMDEEAVLVSAKFLNQNKLQPGDRIIVADGPREVSLVIYGSVSYWPGLLPTGDFFVANLHYIQEHLGLKPYHTWLKMEPNATLAALTDRLTKEQIPVLRIEDARALTAQARRDPQRTGLYGALTIGFVVSAGLTVLGFLLYAVLSLRSRLLQLGVLRAMGLSVGQLLAALGMEQVYTVGVGMLAGSAFGLLAARLYLPLLQLSGDLADGVLPFRIVADPVDRTRLYAILGVMLLGAFASLAAALRSLQIHQAVKLGEDG